MTWPFFPTQIKKTTCVTNPVTSCCPKWMINICTIYINVNILYSWSIFVQIRHEIFTNCIICDPGGHADACTSLNRWLIIGLLEWFIRCLLPDANVITHLDYGTSQSMPEHLKCIHAFPRGIQVLHYSICLSVGCAKVVRVPVSIAKLPILEHVLAYN